MTTETQVVRIAIAPLHMINAFLILGAEGCILVDAGLVGSERAVERALREHGRTFKDLRLIVVTHAHGDHAGGAAAIRAVSGAPLVAHRAERPFLTGEQPMQYCATRTFGRLMLAARIPQQPYPACQADVELTDSPLDLADYGVRGQVLPTQGHTPGSISVLLDSGEALVGDLLASGLGLGGVACLGRACRPVFEQDPGAVALQLRRLLDAGGRRFYLGHGGPLMAPEVRRHAAVLERLVG